MTDPHKSNDRFDTRTVGDFMVRDVVTTRPDATLDEVARAFLQHHIGGIPVVDAAHKPLGIVSKTNIIHTFARGRLVSSGVEDAFDVTFAPSRPAVLVRDVMSPALVLREGDAIEHAAEMFVAKGVHRAPVVGASGELIGIVSAFDLLRAVDRNG
jgi:CBS domain-containing protein